MCKNNVGEELGFIFSIAEKTKWFLAHLEELFAFCRALSVGQKSHSTVGHVSYISKWERGEYVTGGDLLLDCRVNQNHPFNIN